MSVEPSRVLTYRLERPDDQASYALALILDILGLPSRPVPGDCDLYYGSPGTAPAAALVIRPDDSRVLWPGATEDLVVRDDSVRVFPFDVINAVRCLVTDDVNRGLDTAAYDDHQRVRFDSSFQGRHDIGETPVVNIYAGRLGDWLRRRLGLASVASWPAGKRCAIGLSHDVDRLARLSRRLVWPPYATNLGRYENLMAARQRIWQAGQLLRHPFVSDFGLFRAAVSFEARYGCSSTFFFAARHRFGKHASLLDVPYDIGTRRIRRLLGELRQRNFGIGLHASYRAYEAPERFVAERQSLKEASEAPVIGLRHHFWHLGSHAESTLAAHEQAGFAYDTSIAFNEHLGFRRSIAWPYYPWSRALGRPITTLQLPVFCMDGNFFYHSSDVEGAVASISALIERIKSVGGLGVIDWHSDTISPETPGYQAWGVAYERLVRMLADDSQVWTTNLESIVDWCGTRRALLVPGE